MAEKNILIAYLLWFFFGEFGIHRFYLDSVMFGVIYLLSGGLFGIGWIVDAFLIPGMVNSCNQGTTVIQTTVVQPQYQQQVYTTTQYVQ